MKKVFDIDYQEENFWHWSCIRMHTKVFDEVWPLYMLDRGVSIRVQGQKAIDYEHDQYMHIIFI